MSKVLNYRWRWNVIWSLFRRGTPVLEDQYFGRGEKPLRSDTAINKFKIHVKDDVLEDLKRRLSNTRFDEGLENVQFEYGFHPAYLKEVVKYWKDDFDWRKQERELNRFDHFTTEIEGIQVHFIHKKPEIKDEKVEVIPLLMMHGWPGSIVEFIDVLPLLTEFKTKKRDFVFEVICPSIPGYGFSEAPHHKGFSVASAARIFDKLMNRLGFKKYYVHGGDWGSLIATNIAKAYPSRISGVHISIVSLEEGGSLCHVSKWVLSFILPSLILTRKEREKLQSMPEYIKRTIRETGYAHIQATKPDTVGAALNDSPAGLAAYILEKFSTWTDLSNIEKNDGGLTQKYTLDRLLTNVTVYWVSGCVTSSLRLYAETFSKNYRELKIVKCPIKVPSGIAVFPNDIFELPRALTAEYKFQNLIRYSDMPRGGHFAAMEEPHLMAEEIFSFVQDVKCYQKVS